MGGGVYSFPKTKAFDLVEEESISPLPFTRRPEDWSVGKLGPTSPAGSEPKHFTHDDAQNKNRQTTETPSPPLTVGR